MTDQPGMTAARRAPLDGRAMRQGNLGLVLGEVVRRPSISQSDLVLATGLKKATVSRLLDELVRLGWVRTSGAAPGLVGRPRTLFAPDPARGVVVSARVSLDGLSVLAVEFGGTAPRRQAEPVAVAAAPQPEVAAILHRLVAGALAGTSGPVLGASLALSGIVDAGRLGYAPGLTWPDRDATALFRRAVGPRLAADAPLVVENEARLAAVGEQRYGAAAGVDDFVYLLGEVGVGAGVVADGRLFRGTRGAAGEVGHVSIAMDGRRCSCGKTGCWALYVGQAELVRLVGLAVAAGEATSLTDLGPARAGGDLRAADVLSAAREGDAVAGRAVGEVRRALAAGIGNLVSTYDPELVVLGGFLAAAFGDDLTALRTEVDDWVMGGGVHTRLRLEASAVEGASLLGGVALVHDQVVRAPRPD